MKSFMSVFCYSKNESNQDEMEHNYFNEELFDSLLQTSVMGRELVWTDITGSTNDLAIELASQGRPEGLVVVADRQFKSRGRMHREWLSPSGGLWFSILLRPDMKDVRPLTLIFGASISESIEKFTSIPCRFHWPNDIFVDDCKLGGILMESRFMGNRPEYIVAGIGINLNFHVSELGCNLLAKPASLLDLTGTETAPEELLPEILSGLERDYNSFLKDGAEGLIEKFKHRCTTLGRHVRIIRDRESTEDGIAVDITSDGGLVVELSAGGRRTLYSVERLILLETL